MSVSAEEKSLRRRLVFHAMPEDTSVELVERCMEVLENEFGEDPDIRYGKLIKSLSAAVGGGLNFGPVLARIMVMRRMSAEEIGPDPCAGGKTTRSAAPVDGKTAVFNTMFDAIVDQIAKRGTASEQKFRSWMKEQIPSSGITGTCAADLDRWATTGTQSSSVDGSIENYQKIVNLSFVWMCGELGPVETDRVLLRAISVAEQIPEAFDFPPRRLM